MSWRTWNSFGVSSPYSHPTEMQYWARKEKAEASKCHPLTEAVDPVMVPQKELRVTTERQLQKQLQRYSQLLSVSHTSGVLRVFPGCGNHPV